MNLTKCWRGAALALPVALFVGLAVPAASASAETIPLDLIAGSSQKTAEQLVNLQAEPIKLVQLKTVEMAERNRGPNYTKDDTLDALTVGIENYKYSTVMVAQTNQLEVNVGTAKEGGVNSTLKFGMAYIEEKVNAWIDDDRAKEKAKSKSLDCRNAFHETRVVFGGVMPGVRLDPWSHEYYRNVYLDEDRSVEKLAAVIRAEGGRAPGVTDEQRTVVWDVVSQTYRDYLGREASAQDIEQGGEYMAQWIRHTLCDVPVRTREGWTIEKWVDGIRDTDEARAYAPVAVTRVYETYLGRTPDAAGLALHVDALNSKRLTMYDVTKGIYDSAEAVAYRTSLADQYIREVYQVILGRDIDPAGHATWVNAIVSGQLSPAQVTELVRTSDEGWAHAKGLVVALYREFLNREPDADALVHYVNGLVATRMTVPGIAQELRTSEEGKAVAWELVANLYRSELGREPDLAGASGYTLAIYNGEVLPSELAGIFDASEEGNATDNSAANQTVAEVFRTELWREPTSDDLAYWAVKVAAGELSRDELIAQVRQSDERRAVADQVVTEVYLTVLGRSPSAEDLAFWSPTVAAGQLSRDDMVAQVQNSDEARAVAAAIG